MGYFVSLVAVTVAAGALDLAVSGSDGASSRFARLCGALAVILVALSPLAGIREKIADLAESVGEIISDGGDSGGAPSFDSAVADGVAEAVKSAVCAEFSLDLSRVSVRVTLDPGGADAPAVQSVRVSVTDDGGAIPDIARVEEFVSGLTGARAQAVILWLDG